MKNHKFQQIRVTVTKPGDSIRFNAQTDKQYARIRAFMFLFLKNALFLDACWV